MTSIRPIRLAVGWYFTLALPFMLVMAGARLLLSYEFLHIEYVRPGFPVDSYGFTTADRLKYGTRALDFLFSAEGAEKLASIRLPEDKCWQPAGGAPDCALFSARELAHLADVKGILDFSFSLALSCLFITVLCLLAALNGRLSGMYRGDFLYGILSGLRRGAILTLVILLALSVLAASTWNQAFDAFHELFFAAGTWRFPYSDSLIRLYPEQLFVDAAFAIAGFAAAAALLILGALKYGERR